MEFTPTVWHPTPVPCGVCKGPTSYFLVGDGIEYILCKECWKTATRCLICARPTFSNRKICEPCRNS